MANVGTKDGEAGTALRGILTNLTKPSDTVATYNDAVYEISQIKLDNLAGQMTLFESTVDGLKLSVGEQLAPVLKNIYEIGTNAFSWATEFVEENEWIVGAITGVAVTLGALAAGVTALSIVPQIVAALKTALDLLIANPVVAVTAAVVGLAAAVAT